MKVIYNRFIPFKGYKCVNLLGVLFVREGCVMSETDYNHEAIHTAQMRELLYVFFYLLYVLEWLVNLVRFRHGKTAYYEISFEREAYRHQEAPDYLKFRKKFNQYKENYGNDRR